MYINDLLLRINYVSEQLLFAHDTSVIIPSRNFKDFCSVSNLFLSRKIKWFADNNLVGHLDTMKRMRFITKNSSHSTLPIGYKEKRVEEMVNTKFLGFEIDNQLN
jgi:hypothetical protein